MNDMMYNGEEGACLHALQYIGATLTSMTLNTAIELGIFEIIEKGCLEAPLSAADIASHLLPTNSINVLVLDRMLRLLTAECFLIASLQGTQLFYSLAPAAKFFTKDKSKGSLAYLHALTNHGILINTWKHMKDSLVEGGDKYKKLQGLSMYEAMQNDATLNSLFIDAMAGVSRLNMAKILEEYNGFESLSSVVDVGGSDGHILAMILSKYPNIKGINFDLAHVVQIAPRHVGVEHVAGDMFESIPSADAIILKDILHNWSDEHCLKILRNCYDALPNSGKIIIIALILPQVPKSNNATRYIVNVDYIMVQQFPGKERTENEYSELCMASGFQKCHVAYVAYKVWSVIEFLKY